MLVGILAVQGDFEAHAAMLAKLGAGVREVRRAGELQGLDGLVLPGGESTTQMHFLRTEGLAEAIQQMAKNGGAFFGTCAGVILLAQEVQNPQQESLGLADVSVVRNGYGRQLDSGIFALPTKLTAQPLEAVFIRAPIVERTGPGWKVLAERDGKPVLLRKGKILLSTFHPELTGDTTIHKYFLGMLEGRSA